MKHDVARSWFSDRFPQDTLRAVIQAGSSAGGGGDEIGASTSSSKSLYNMAVHGELRGLDRQRRLVYHERSVCLYLTDGQLLVSSIRGQFKMRPNELLHTIDRTGLRCEWFDYEETGNRSRNFIFHIADGTWMGVATATKALGRETKLSELVNDFVEQLGTSATEIDWRNPPPL